MIISPRRKPLDHRFNRLSGFTQILFNGNFINFNEKIRVNLLNPFYPWSNIQKKTRPKFERVFFCIL